MPSSFWRVLLALLLATAGLAWVARSLGEGAFSTADGEAALDATVPRHTRGRNPAMIIHLRLNVEHLKWLWWPFLLYIFWGMAHVCEEYFVRAIQVISERWQIPDDIAGATLMALGCNGPEMSLNTIAIFNPSDIGVGAVIGGEVFNVLVIIGAAMLATPQKYLPLEISRFSFGRDVIFYIVSVIILYFILRDGFVSRGETLILLGGAVSYSTTVIFSSRIRAACITFMNRFAPRPKEHVPSGSLQAALDGGTGTASFASTVSAPDCPDCRTASKEPSEDAVKAWAKARMSADPASGSVVAIKVDVRSRMIDQHPIAFRRFMWLTQDALMVSAAVEPFCVSKGLDRSTVLVYDTAMHLWYHGGLVNVPGCSEEPSFQDASITQPNDLGEAFLKRASGEETSPRKVSLGSEAFVRNVSGSETSVRKVSGSKFFSQVSNIPFKAMKQCIKNIPCETIPLEDILYCDPVKGNGTIFTIHVHERIHERHMGVGRLITLEFVAETQAVHDAWVEALRKVLRERAHLKNRADQPPPRRSCNIVLGELVAWFQFPVRLLASLTIPDMDNPARQDLYPVAFLMSMAWLAVFAFLVVESCHGIHRDFGISTGLLGFTVAAAGTSFPNVFSGMVVSRQGKTSMAIANALGANVQNVFLALAIPWTIQAWFRSNDRFAMPVQGLESQVAEIYITLLPVLSIFIFYNGKMPGWSGAAFLVTYLLYLVIALGQEQTCCDTWPVLRCAEQQVVC